MWAWLGYWLFVFAIMHIPKPPGVSVSLYGGDKIIHASAYLLLALLGGRAARRRGRTLTLGWGLLWLAIYAAYGAADEWLQGFVGRTPSVWDWTADVGGATIGLCVSILDKRER